MERLQVAAFKKAESVGTDIADTDMTLSDRIVRLFREQQCTMDAVAECLVEDLPDARSLSARRTVVRAVLHARLTDEELSECTKRNRANHRDNAADAIAKGKRQWDAEQGHVSFSPEENAFFWYLILYDQDCRRPGRESRVHHRKVRDRMLARFPDRPFQDKDLMRDRYAHKIGYSTGVEDAAVLQEQLMLLAAQQSS